LADSNAPVAPGGLGGTAKLPSTSADDNNDGDPGAQDEIFIFGDFLFERSLRHAHWAEKSDLALRDATSAAKALSATPGISFRQAHRLFPQAGSCSLLTRRLGPLHPHMRLDPGPGASIDLCAVNDLSPLEDKVPVGDAKCKRKMLLDDDNRCADLVTKTRQDL
jgi:hypothetical protein